MPRRAEARCLPVIRQTEDPLLGVRWVRTLFIRKRRRRCRRSVPPHSLVRRRWRQSVIHCCSRPTPVRLSGHSRYHGRHGMQSWLAFGPLPFFRSVFLSMSLDVLMSPPSFDSHSTVRTVLLARSRSTNRTYSHPGRNMYASECGLQFNHN